MFADEKPRYKIFLTTLVFFQKVDDCASGEYSAIFNTGKINQEEVGGRPVQHLYPFIKNLRVWRR